MTKRVAIKKEVERFQDSDMLQPEDGVLIERSNRSEWLDNPLEGLDIEIEKLMKDVKNNRS